MKCLGGCNQVNAVVAQRSGFSGSVNTLELLVGNHECFGRGPHLGVWFDTKNGIPSLKKHF
jgi:hypothetical protein